MYRPGVIVLQCGADSLAGDRLGCFNLSIDGVYFIVINALFFIVINALDPPFPSEGKKRKKESHISFAFLLV